METKYFNDSIIGNKNVTVSLSKTGELLRLYYPSNDNRQFIDFWNTGVQINDSNFICLHKDINNVYEQYYEKDTNIIHTEILNTYFNLKIQQTDFVSIKENVLIKKYQFENEGKIDLHVNFLLHSKLLTSQNNIVGSIIKENGLIQYAHDYVFAILAKKHKITDHMLNNTEASIQSGKIHDKDYIGMAPDASINYEIGTLKPGEKKTIEICVIIKENDEKVTMKNQKDVEDIFKKMDIEKEYASTKAYWKKYLKEHNTISLRTEENAYQKKVEEIYKRTILLFPLLINQETGGIAATLEIDEERTKCGMYNFCWTRDAVFITKAFDLLKMNKETEKFYKTFCKNTQSSNGMWEQRFYTDGKLAPCWGYQIDETASVVFGVYEHYEQTKDKKFLKDTLKMCEKATGFLKKYSKDLFSNEPKMHVSYDIWEMNEGVHLYSIASIFAAFEAMIAIYREVKDMFENNRLKLEAINKELLELSNLLVTIKKYVLEEFYDTKQKSFKRNLKDQNMDISMMGIVVPFHMFTPKEKKVTNTVEKINLTLRTYTGGYLRFEQDNYLGGKNPWTITTLWMALYYIENKQYKKAKQCFDYVTKTASLHGFIPEQVNNETLEPAWIIGLGWAHAMYILVLEKLNRLGLV